MNDGCGGSRKRGAEDGSSTSQPKVRKVDELSVSGLFTLTLVEPLLEEGHQSWELPLDRPTTVGLAPGSGGLTFSCFALSRSQNETHLILIFVGCDIEFDLKPVIPSLDRFVENNVGFSPSSNFRLEFSAKDETWTVKCSSSIRIRPVYVRGLWKELTFPSSGGSFLIALSGSRSTPSSGLGIGACCLII